LIEVRQAQSCFRFSDLSGRTPEFRNSNSGIQVCDPAFSVFFSCEAASNTAEQENEVEAIAGGLAEQVPKRLSGSARPEDLRVYWPERRIMSNEAEKGVSLKKLANDGFPFSRLFLTSGNTRLPNSTRSPRAQGNISAS